MSARITPLVLKVGEILLNNLVSDYMKNFKIPKIVFTLKK